MSLRLESIAFVEFIVATLFKLPRLKCFNPIKKATLRLLGASIGHGCTFYPGVWIFPGKNLVVGDQVDFAHGVLVTTNGGVEIGDRVLIGYNSTILSRNHNIPENFDQIFSAGHTSKKVVLEKDVWIGANCTILPGVRVGEGAVVAAGSVVTKDVEPFSIYGGVPAKKIRDRQ